MRKLLLALSCALLCPGASPPLLCYRPYAEQMVLRSAAQHHVPAALIRAVIHVESNWNPGAVSSAGALGLMQLMPATARSLQVDHPFWIDQNIEGGTAYLSSLYQRFQGDWRLALAAYYAGPDRVGKCGLQYSSREVFTYVTRVLVQYQAERAEKGKSR